MLNSMGDRMVDGLKGLFESMVLTSPSVKPVPAATTTSARWP